MKNEIYKNYNFFAVPFFILVAAELRLKIGYKNWRLDFHIFFYQFFSYKFYINFRYYIVYFAIWIIKGVEIVKTGTYPFNASITIFCRLKFRKHFFLQNVRKIYKTRKIWIYHHTVTYFIFYKFSNSLEKYFQKSEKMQYTEFYNFFCSRKILKIKFSIFRYSTHVLIDTFCDFWKNTAKNTTEAVNSP